MSVFRHLNTYTSTSQKQLGGWRISSRFSARLETMLSHLCLSSNLMKSSFNSCIDTNWYKFRQSLKRQPWSTWSLVPNINKHLQLPQRHKKKHRKSRCTTKTIQLFSISTESVQHCHHRNPSFVMFPWPSFPAFKPRPPPRATGKVARPCKDQRKKWDLF